MGATKDLMIRIREEEYYLIPMDVRERYFHSNMITPELRDWNELMQDEMYCKLYKEKKKISGDLEQRAFDLREQKRKVNSIEVITNN